MTAAAGSRETLEEMFIRAGAAAWDVMHRLMGDEVLPGADVSTQIGIEGDNDEASIKFTWKLRS